MNQTDRQHEGQQTMATPGTQRVSSRMSSKTRSICIGLAAFAMIATLSGATALRAQGVLTLTPGATVTATVGTPGTLGYSGNGAAATAATLARPSGLAYDAAGNLYIADAQNHVVREVSAAGVISTLAGSGQQGYAGDGAAATSAQLDTPTGVAVDSNGNLYIADSHNHVVRKVTGGTISTVAGTGTAGFSGDGSAATGATFFTPMAVALDGSGNLYIADTGNHRVREISGGTVSTVAGTGAQAESGDGGAATAAALDSPAGLAFDASGNLYIADSHNHAVRVVQGGTITTFAGTGTLGFAGDGGAATSAALANPIGVSTDALGNVYIADTLNQRVRVVNGGTIGTVAGTGAESAASNGTTATVAALDEPRAALASPAQTLTVADTLNQAVEAVVPAAVSFGSTAVGTSSSTQTVALGNSGSAALTVGRESLPTGFAVSGGSCGAVPIAIAAGASCSVLLVFTPTAVGVASGAVGFGGTGVVPQALLVSGTGTAGAKTITFPPPVTPQSVGVQATLAATASNGDAVTYSITAGTATLSGATITYTTPGTVTVQASSAATANYAAATPVSQSVTVVSGYIWVENGSGSLLKLSESGASASSVLGTAGTAGTRGGIAFDAAGDAWSVNAGTNALSFLTAAGGSAASYSSSGLSAPVSVAVDGAGALWVANSGNNTVSVFTNAGVAKVPATGWGGSDGLNAPSAVVVDAAGSVWVANKNGNSVTHIFGTAAPVVTPLANATKSGTLGTTP